MILDVSAAIIIVRFLGPPGKGTYSLTILPPTFLLIFGNIGIGGANIYFGGKKKYNWSNIVSN